MSVDRGKHRRFHRSTTWTKATDDFVRDQLASQGGEGVQRGVVVGLTGHFRDDL